MVRIIGGQWRGRKLPVVDRPGLRPTGDRLRETLFNWLAPTIPGARCLDLFAGTGALGLEAASRGAREVVLVEADRAAADALAAVIDTLGASGVTVVRDDARRYLGRAPASFDVVFLDPPFDSELLRAVLPALLPLLRPGALLYVEQAAAAPLAAPAGVEAVREQRFGEVRAALWRAGEAAPADCYTRPSQSDE